MIRRGILFAALALGALAGACGDEAPAAPDAAATDAPDAGEDGPAGPDLGRWRPAPPRGAPPSDLQGEIEALEAIGYSGGVTDAPETVSVTRHVRERALQGTNFYSSGHAPAAVLMDMDGKVLHTWRVDPREVWPGERVTASLEFWRRAFLQPNGDVLAIFEGHSLIRVDKDSKVLWKSACKAHHDLEVLANGDILVLTRKAHVVPGFDPERPVLEDFVTLLDADGNEKRSVSVLEALERSGPEVLRERARKRRQEGDRMAQNGDVLHTNTLALLDGSLAARIPAFARGNVLLSSRTLSFLAVLDLEKGELAWTLEGEFKEQHDPKVLANGNLLVFDNTGRGLASTVRELDPVTGKSAWEYRGTDADPFFSRTCGTADRLANGNTLITESDGGRAFEVTPDGEIVWEFWNPERVVDPKSGKEYIAVVLELVRLGPEVSLDWR